MLSEVIVFRRFRNTNPATMMIASFALGFAIRNFLLMLYSSRPKSITLWPSLSLPVEVVLPAHGHRQTVPRSYARLPDGLLPGLR